MAPERDALIRFLEDVEARLRGLTTEGPEAQLAGPLRTLLRTIAALRGRPGVDLFDQATEPGIGRPDFSVKDGALLVGHVESKPLGKGADPNRFTDAHDKDQWKRFKRLPNLLYTDGREFSLFRSGEIEHLRNGRPAHVAIPLNPSRKDGRVVTDAEVRDFVDLVTQFIAWQPIAPRSLPELAERLAPLCATLRDAVEDALGDDASSVSLVTHEVRDALFPDADDRALADAYAQTCAYSLLLAQAEGASQLDAAAVEATLRDGHPVLARVVRVLLDPDAEAEIAWAVEIVRRQVGAADLAKLSGGDPDTWIYFYEDFLGAYDPSLRDSRGVYYTPKEVIRAQVSICEDILTSRFARPEGFADEGVVVLDPAVGTGSYPLRVVASAAASAGRLGPGFVPAAITDLARRLHAFEVLVGPYAVAHLRLSEALRGHGGSLPPDGLRLYLTDTLASPHRDPPLISAVAPLVREQRRAAEFKATVPVVVCLGNPPYDREQHDVGHTGRRRGGWVRYGEEGQTEEDRPLLEDWLAPLADLGLGAHAKNAYNDYIYFWRWGVWKLFEKHPEAVVRRGGILTYISASSFLRGPAFAIMRQRLRELCDDIYVLDLGGEGRGPRRSENVFDIMTPVAITICIREPGEGQRAGRVHYADWSDGTRAEKLARPDGLRSLEQVEWRPGLSGKTDPLVAGPDGAWATWPLLVDLFPWRHTGAELKRTWPIAPTKDCLRQRWEALVEAPVREREALFRRTRDRTIETEAPPLYAGELNRLPIAVVPSDTPLPEEDIVPYEFRSFDREYLIADERLGDYLKPVLWRTHSARQFYIATLTTHPLGNGPAITIASVSPPDRHFYRGSYGGADVMPLYRDADASRPNLPARLLEALSSFYGRDVAAEELLAYVVGMLGTAAYSAHFATELREPGPRVPLTADSELFGRAADLGARLIFLQSRGERFGRPGWSLPKGTARIETAIPSSVADCPVDASYDAATMTLHIGPGQVRPVAPEVWNFEVSGYRAVQEWILRRLAQPRGKTSSPLDQVRPIAWGAALQRELLATLAIVEEVVTELTPQAIALLDEVLAGALLAATELPSPTPAERKAPRSS